MLHYAESGWMNQDTNSPMWFSILPILERKNWGTQRFSNLQKVTSNHLTYHLKSSMLWWVRVAQATVQAWAAGTWQEILLWLRVLNSCRLIPAGGICGPPPSGGSSRALWGSPSDRESEFYGQWGRESWMLIQRRVSRRREGSGFWGVWFFFK